MTDGMRNDGEHAAAAARMMQDALAAAAQEIASEEQVELSPEQRIRDAWGAVAYGLPDACIGAMLEVAEDAMEFRPSIKEEPGAIVHQMVARQMITEALIYLETQCHWTPDMLYDAVADYIPGMKEGQRAELRKWAKDRFTQRQNEAVRLLLPTQKAA